MSISNQTLSHSPKSQKELDRRYMPSAKKQSDNFFTNFSSVAIAATPLVTKGLFGVSFYSMASGSYALLDGNSDASLLKIGFGLAAYSVLKFAQSGNNMDIMSLESANVMSEVGKYQTRTWDADKQFGHKSIREYVKRTTKGAGLTLSGMMNKVARTFPVLHHRYTKGVIQQEDVNRAMFLYQVLSDLDNDKSPQAMFIKSQQAFQREEVRELLSDSNKFANVVAEQKLSTGKFGEQIYKALGEDAHLVVKSIDDYFKGKREFMGLELDAYKDAMKSMHVEVVHQEMTYRMVGFLGKIETKGDVSLFLEHNREDALDGIRTFVKDEFKNAPYSDLKFKEMVRYAEEFIESFEGDMPGWQVTEACESMKKRLGLEGVPLDGINQGFKGRDKYQITNMAVGHMMSNGTSNKYDMTRSFHRMYIDSLITKVSDKIETKANKDFSEKSLSKLSDAQKEDLKENYGVNGMSNVTPEGVIEAVMTRIKTRLYYGMHEEKIEKDFSFQQSMEM